MHNKESNEEEIQNCILSDPKFPNNEIMNLYQDKKDYLGCIIISKLF